MIAAAVSGTSPEPLAPKLPNDAPAVWFCWQSRYSTPYRTAVLTCCGVGGFATVYPLVGGNVLGVRGVDACTCAAAAGPAPAAIVPMALTQTTAVRTPAHRVRSD